MGEEGGGRGGGRENGRGEGERDKGKEGGLEKRGGKRGQESRRDRREREGFGHEWRRQTLHLPRTRRTVPVCFPSPATSGWFAGFPSSAPPGSPEGTPSQSDREEIQREGRRREGGRKREKRGKNRKKKQEEQISFDVCMNNQWTVPLWKKEIPRCYTKSPTVQYVFQPIPSFISCTTVILASFPGSPECELYTRGEPGIFST